MEIFLFAVNFLASCTSMVSVWVNSLRSLNDFIAISHERQVQCAVYLSDNSRRRGYNSVGSASFNKQTNTHDKDTKFLRNWKTLFAAVAWLVSRNGTE
jgi:triacylglycerol esterase/lipase EstA (alpha/beta hydrolase family)